MYFLEAPDLQRFLILPGVRVKNLASKVLALNVRRLSGDWQASFNHPLLLAETFVDERRFAGTCYLAAGWSKLGHSLGYGRAGGKYYFHGQPKAIWVRPLHPAARQWLAAPFDPPLLSGAPGGGGPERHRLVASRSSAGGAGPVTGPS